MCIIKIWGVYLRDDFDDGDSLVHLFTDESKAYKYAEIAQNVNSNCTYTVKMLEANDYLEYPVPNFIVFTFHTSGQLLDYAPKSNREEYGVETNAFGLFYVDIEYTGDMEVAKKKARKLFDEWKKGIEK